MTACRQSGGAVYSPPSFIPMPFFPTTAIMALSIEDKYLKEEGQVFLTGIEAIVRLILEKQRRDQAEGAVNQTYISGYEGSPLGGLDLKVVEQLDLLNQRGRTVHQFGINEKTAASAMLGTQYGPDGDVDAFWYGKAHGTMWIPDEVWLANLAGSAGRGSMVLLSGEDHRSKSSVSPGAADWVLRSSWVPVFYPASVEEILLLGLHAVALSRYLGVVTALKLTTPVCDGASTVDLAAVRPQIHLPEAYDKRFNRIVMATNALPMQRELVEDKWPLVEAYIGANAINRIVDGDAGGEVGIVATGKSYADVRQVLDAMGLRVPVLHLRVSYPLEIQMVRQFGRGLRTVYVVEEPGPFVEEGVKAALWNSGVEAVYGQYDELGKAFIPAHGEVDPELLARLLGPRIKGGVGSAFLRELEAIENRERVPVPAVSPMSCGGCPYNSFRDLDEKPGGAIGCSSIRATPAYDDGVLYIPTMGAGGSIYSGWAQFNGNQHIFQYLGDGSYFHSGRGAVQSCVQGQVNITFLLLFNGAVALTGGQQPAGQRSIGEVAQELRGLGVGTIGIVSEEPERHRKLSQVEVYGLERHGEALQRFAQLAGTTALILDKECATEKGRRNRRAGIAPQRYILIDEDVCEGCGDCYEQSEGCAALYSIATDLGPKTQVRQANCAQDELCVDGECPSFISAIPAPGTRLKRRRPEALDQLPEPPLRTPGRGYTIFAIGRGGTGVVTISHLLAYAAMMEGRYVYLSNNTGLAQKGGPVEAPIVLSDAAQPVFNRLFPGQADLYLGFDLIRAAEAHNLQYAHPDRSLALVSSALVPTAGMNRNPTAPQPDPDRLQAAIDQCSRKSDNVYLDTYWVAERLFGDILYANMLLLGAAYQAGGIPLRAASIETAIELNGKAVEANIQAFRWGRLCAADPARVERELKEQAEGNKAEASARSAELENLRQEALADIETEGETRRLLLDRLDDLAAYQDTAYARQYLDIVRRTWRADREFPDRDGRLTAAVVRQLFKLMAYKDEYEVARLLTRPQSLQRVRDLFDGPVEVANHLHPPSLRWLGLSKLRLGPVFRPLLRLLARGKGLRGTVWDPFGRTSCRRLERALIDWYREVLDEGVAGLREETYSLVLDMATAPEAVRGYEEIKEKNAARVREQVSVLREKLARVQV